MKHKINKVLSILLALALVLGLAPAVSIPARAAQTQDPIKYLDETGAEKECTNYTVIDESTTDWQTGWYVLSSSVEISDRITVTGNVHLILVDDCTLTASNGVRVEGENSLTIYGQSAGTGKLIAKSMFNSSGYGYAAIGGNNGGNGSNGSNGGKGGNITINGGTVEAAGSHGGAAIGGGRGGDGYGGNSGSAGGDGGTLTINGGTVTATSDDTAIGGGMGGYGHGGNGGAGGDGGNITINGGTVTANSIGTAIGGGMGGSGRGGDGGAGGAGGNITINGGTATANGANTAIGGGMGGRGGDGGNGGAGGDGGTLTINGGTVTATSYGTAIGGGGGDDGGDGGNGGTVTINGGTVTATTDRYVTAIGGGRGGDGGSDGNGGTVKLGWTALSDSITVSKWAQNVQVTLAKNFQYADSGEKVISDDFTDGKANGRTLVPLVPKTIELGAGGIVGPTEVTDDEDPNKKHYTPNSYVYFGVNGDGEDKSPIQWRVLDAEKANDGTTDGVFLLSEYLLADGVYFQEKVHIHSDGKYYKGDGVGVNHDDCVLANVYKGSDGQAWCKDFADNKKTGKFSGAEQAAMLGVDKADSEEGSLYDVNWDESSLTTADKVFFPSVRELADYVGNYDRADGLQAFYMKEGASSAGVWWLRSPHADFASRAGAVHDDGVVGYDYVSHAWAARPALNLNLESVLFTSSPDGKEAGASGLAPVEPYAGSEWKLTLKDTENHRDFDAAVTAVDGEKLTVAWDLAKTGENEYLSAVIKDNASGALTHYGRLKKLENESDKYGTREIDLSGINMTGKTLYVFNEQYNGEKKTDYAGKLVELPTDAPNAYPVELSVRGFSVLSYWNFVRPNSKVTNVYLKPNPGYYHGQEYHKLQVEIGDKVYGNEALYYRIGYPDELLVQVMDPAKQGSGFSGKVKITYTTEAIPYDIKYELDGGTNNENNPKTYTVEDTIPLADPEWTGYTFDGWYDNAGFSGSPVTEIPKNSTENKTFWAKWTADVYNIDYQNLNGASNSNPKTYTIVDTPLTLAALTGGPTGHTFGGWYDNPAFDGDAVTEIPANSTGDKTFYAKWTANKYTVTFDANGHGTAPAAQTVEYGKTATKPADPTASGWKFEGWYKEAECTDAFDFSAPITGNITLFAKWTKDGGKYGDDDNFIAQYTLKYETNGGSSVDASRHSRGATVDLTVTPTREGYTFTGWYADAALTEKITSVKMDGSKTVYAGWQENSPAVPVHDCPSAQLKDVDANAWYHEYIDYVVENGLMQGVAEDRFAPNLTTSRAMIVTILYRLEGQPAVSGTSPFDDVTTGQWYADAVIWANANGIVEGYGNGRFGPNDLITREQLAAILYRYAKFKGYDVSVGQDTNILSYDDAFEVSDWAMEAMQWAVGSGLITGRTETTLVPRGEATRAEAAAILMRFIENAK